MGLGPGNAPNRVESPQVPSAFPAEATINKDGELGVLGGSVLQRASMLGVGAVAGRVLRAAFGGRQPEARLPGRNCALLCRVGLETRAIVKSTAKPWKSYWQRPHLETGGR